MQNPDNLDDIKDFWDWIIRHKDYVGVQRIEDDFFLYVAFDHDMLDSLTDRYQYFCEEGGCPCKIHMNGLCFNLADLEDGNGYTLEELWQNRPAGVEAVTGRYIY